MLGWFPLGRRRAYHRAQHLLQQGQWQPALTLVREQQNDGNRSPAWDEQFRALEAECHRQAAEAARAEQRYENALEHLLVMARLLGLTEAEVRGRLVEGMLADARRLFAAGPDADAVQPLLARIRFVHTLCRHASVPLALCPL